jgi:serine O-acetyltransferase
MNADFLIQNIYKKTHSTKRNMPSKHDAISFIEELINLIFPVRNEVTDPISSLQTLKQLLEKNLSFLLDSRETRDQINDSFFDALDEIYHLLLKDAEAFLKFDPAAKSMDEVILAYPGFYAISVYRFANILYRLEVPILPRIIAEHAHSITGIDIHPGATIGEYFFIDHGTGVVIGETCTIGNHVKMYQGVTLGALIVNKEQSNKKRHPTIEDNVIIYSGSTILGGNTIIGHDTVIGGNVWLTESVPSFSLVYHKSEVKVRTSKDFDEPINFVI